MRKPSGFLRFSRSGSFSSRPPNSRKSPISTSTAAAIGSTRMIRTTTRNEKKHSIRTDLKRASRSWPEPEFPRDSVPSGAGRESRNRRGVCPFRDRGTLHPLGDVASSDREALRRSRLLEHFFFPIREEYQ